MNERRFADLVRRAVAQEDQRLKIDGHHAADAETGGGAEIHALDRIPVGGVARRD
ncbi:MULTISPECIES: hypothetical protein [Methylorubrum]|uniref:hypothetical protein n=1 Tax=Methylorubrum TaxID=2282523 RepID=UPI0013016415|nr:MULTISPECIES: hypothetical protein [Methylorubrum]MCP1543426.1 hypothetical protein [Methylorubrum extorquens]MCP1589229.1 hypothetical protein [Methylorubrum extorquens]